MDSKDFLVIYEFLYKYSDKVDEECQTNIGRTIKGFLISDLAELDTKMNKSLANAWMKDKYVNHRILEIKQPFNLNKEPSIINILSRKILEHTKKYNDSVKKANRGVLGVRG